MAWTYTFDTATPSGATQAVSILDDSIREVKNALRERLDIDHAFSLTGTQVSAASSGRHRKVQFCTPLSAKPTLSADESALYIKAVSGKSELFFEDEDGDEIQLTTGGKINIKATTVPDDVIDDGMILLANASPLRAVDTAGTGEVELIAAGQNEAGDTEVAVLPDETRLNSNAAPTEDTQVPNKKYVDDSHKYYVKVSDVKVNADGGSISATTWTTRDLNTEDTDTKSICTLAANRVTLSAGTYRCRIIVPGQNCGWFYTRLYNVTGAAMLLQGMNSGAGTANNVVAYSIIEGQFTVAASQALEVQMYCTSSRVTDGLGNKISTGNNVYTVAEFWKVL